ncbi:MAG TPA: hypothetical protein VFL90_05215 [Methylomirabilota bacterium]|nr:hypothetical protein [Methylomirabilota bacterium]
MDCRVPYEMDEAELVSQGFVPQGRGPLTLHRGRGCQVCNFTGVKGRVALYEVMPVTREIRDLIVAGAGAAEIKQVEVREGTTTLEEVRRVTGE